MKREDVYKALDTERDYQNRVWNGTKSSRQPSDAPDAMERTIDEFALYIAGYAQELVQIASHTDHPEKKLDHIRKIGALCVACGEAHGMPERVDLNQEAKELVNDMKEKAKETKEKVDEKVDQASGRIKEWADKAVFEYRAASRRAGKRAGKTADEIEKHVDEFMEQVDKDGLSRETFNWLKKKYFG